MWKLRTLALSLLLTIVVASIGSGLLLDNLYARLYAGQGETVEFDPKQLEFIGKRTAKAVSQIADREAFLKVWQQENAPISLELVNRDNIGMPEEMHQQLESAGHITLSSSTNVTFYALLQEDDQYLAVRAPFVGKLKPHGWAPVLFTAVFYTLLLVVVLAWLFPLMRRLKAVQRSAQQLGEGDLTARISPGGISQIREIENEFNRMASRIEELVSDMGLLSSAVSHELRSPLAKLQFGLDALREERDEQTRALFHDRLDAVIVNMTDLVETLLVYARADKGAVHLQKAQVDLRALCASLVESLVQVDVKVDANQQSYCVDGDEFYLRLLLENVLANAIKYGSGKILIRFKQSQTETALSIDDNGPGIEEEFKQHIFKPFIRAEAPARGEVEPNKGYGLGMALAKRIADLHGAKIEIEKSETLGGASVSLSFPQ